MLALEIKMKMKKQTGKVVGLLLVHIPTPFDVTNSQK
jgi:hypothetical protein